MMEETKVEKNLAEENANTNEEHSEQKKENKKEIKKERKLIEKIESLEKELAEWKDKYYRAFADIDNLRKQYQNENRQIIKYQSQNVIEKILPSLDVFSMVIGNADNLPTEVKSYVMGFDAVYRQLLQALESEGMNEIKCNIGDNFDHNIHYAMDTVEVDDENMIGKIMKVYVKGYKLHDRLIRPATVSVGAKKEEKEAEKDSAQA